MEVGTAAINNAPTITSTPAFLAAPGMGYIYQVQASDPDAGDALTYQLLKAPSGVTIDATTGKVEWANPIVGTYQVVVGAVDEQGVGAAQGFTLTVRANQAPVITSIAPETTALSSTYRYDVRATDVDGDRLSYSLDRVSVDRGMAIDALGRLVWTPSPADLGQTYEVTISVTDEQGATTPQTFSLTVARDTQAPNVTVFATQDLIDVGSTVTLIARATDNVSVANLTLVVDGKAVVLDANGRATVTLLHVGSVQAIATATDSSFNQNSATTTIHVIDPNANFDPTLSFDFSSLKDGVITAPTDLIGTVVGSGITRYELAIAPLSGGEFKTIFTGTGSVDDGVLGKFDPSLLENDSYTIRLTAFDANGNSSSIEDTINVAGELKLGNFRLSFTDLSVPVTGIPITLTRTYDSLTSSTSDDFGYGWRMEFRDTDLRTSLKRTPEEELLGTYPAFKDGTRVYITLPGGKREGFTFKPTGDRFNQFFGAAPDAAMYHPAFTADKGITDRLSRTCGDKQGLFK